MNIMRMPVVRGIALLSLLFLMGFSTEPIESGSTVHFLDSTGRSLTVPKTITRIAVTGPIAQMVVFAIAPDSLAGVAAEWDHASREYLDRSYLELPVLGQLYGGKGNLNVEQLLSVDPQIVVDVGESKPGIAEDMDALSKLTGIPFVHFSSSLSDTGTVFMKLGELLNLQGKGIALSKYCTEVYSRTSAISAAARNHEPSLLYCLGEKGLNVIAKGSYHSEILDLLSNNAAVLDSPSAKGLGNTIDFEQLLTWDPDVVIFSPKGMYEKAADDPVWKKMRAIESGNYYEVPLGIHNWMGFPPSIQRYMGMQWLAKLLYPEYAHYDLYDETVRFYDLFYHFKLTRAQFDAFTFHSLNKR